MTKSKYNFFVYKLITLFKIGLAMSEIRVNKRTDTKKIMILYCLCFMLTYSTLKHPVLNLYKKKGLNGTNWCQNLCKTKKVLFESFRKTFQQFTNFIYIIFIAVDIIFILNLIASLSPNFVICQIFACTRKLATTNTLQT